jgi:hypothetical protein
MNEKFERYFGKVPEDQMDVLGLTCIWAISNKASISSKHGLLRRTPIFQQHMPAG